MRHKKICKKIIAVGIAVLLIAVSCMPMTGMRSQAATFEDNGNTVDIYTDNDYLCIRYNGSWSGYLNERFDLSADGVSLDRLNAIILNNENNGDGSSFSVKDAWSAEISGASGTVTNTGKKQYYGYEFMTWKIQVPLDTYEAFNLDTLKVTYKGQSTEVAIGTKNTTEEASTENTEEITSATEKDSTEEILTTEDTTETEKNDTTVPRTTEQGVTEAVSEDTTADSTDESTTEISGTESEDSSATIPETTSEDNNNASTTGEMTDEATTETTGGIHVGGNIQIDGYYDDWEGRPKTEITYSSNNKQCNHYGQLALDGDTLYGHFKMNELYTSGMQLQIWYLTINGKTFAMQIHFDERYPVLSYQNSEIRSDDFAEEDRDFSTAYITGTDTEIGTFQMGNQKLTFLGMKDDLPNVYFLGLNLMYEAVSRKDAALVDILNDVLGISNEQLPDRELVPITIAYKEDGLSIDVDADFDQETGVNTSIAAQDIFTSDQEISEQMNLLVVHERHTEISFVYPMFVPGIIITISGFICFILCICMDVRDRRKHIV